MGLMRMHKWLVVMSSAQTTEVDLEWSTERQLVEAEGATAWLVDYKVSVMVEFRGDRESTAAREATSSLVLGIL